MSWLQPMEPALKWAGSKRWAIPRLRELYAPHRYRRLHEPFVGSMAVALGLRPRSAFLADRNPHLVNFHRRLRDPRPFAIAMVNEAEAYYAARARFNALVAAPDGLFSDEAAELFWYLNRTCFNGLCRFNSSGEFNVPHGKYKTLNYRRDFSEYALVTANWAIACGTFEQWRPESEDFVYIDPPYDGTFTAYSGDEFTWEDQVALAQKYAAHPGPVVASNAATDRILELYGDLGFEIELVEVARSISAKGDRKKAKEVLATRNVAAKLLIAVPNTESEPESETESAIEYVDETTTATETENGDDPMANLPPEMAQEVGKARSAGGGTYIQHGDYVMMIKKWFYQKIQDRCIILELIPIEARKKVVYEGTKKVENEPNPPGSECSATANFDGEGKQSAPANSRAPVLALFNFKEGEIADEIVASTLDQVVDQQKQPAAGMLIALSTFPKKIRNPKSPDRLFITGLNWSCVNKPKEGLNAPALVQARLDALKLGPEQLVKLGMEQITAARATGAAPALPSTETTAPPPGDPSEPPPPAPVAAAPAQPAPADPMVVLTQQGWTPHPNDATWMMRGSGATYEAKKKADLIASVAR